jgi:hypothetical protein
MFSAFYTNGQFIIVEPNDIDYAKMDNIDELINGVYPVGKAKADENGNNIVNTYATKNELLNGNPKPLYHLGAYDKPVDNGDGTTTITRQTGYLNVVDLLDSFYQYSWSEVIFEANIPLSIITDIGQTSQWVNYTLNDMTNYTKDNVYGTGSNNHSVSILNDRLAIKDTSANINTLKQYLSQHPLYIQYKLATSYQEKVITNQPLNTLDQKGSQWVRSEWEKSINILDIPNVPNTTVRGVTYNFSNGVITLNGTATAGDIILTGYFNATFENGIYYYNSFGGDNAYLQMMDNRGNFISNGTVVVDREVTFRLVITAGITFNNYKITPMLVKGSNPYPYVPYNANKHITNDEATLIKGEYENSLNLLNLPDVPSTTKYGITYKVKDGVLTLNGTATDTVNLVLCLVRLPEGTYYFKSFGATGTNSTYFTQVERVTSLGAVLASSYDNKSITIPPHNGIYYRLVVRQGETLSNVQFKDMITKGDKPTPEFYPYKGNIVHEKDLVDFRNELPLIKTFNGTYQEWLNQNISDSRVIKMKVILLLTEGDTPSYVDANCGYSTDAEDTNYFYYKYDTSEYSQVSATDNVIVYYI